MDGNHGAAMSCARRPRHGRRLAACPIAHACSAIAARERPFFRPDSKSVARGARAERPEQAGDKMAIDVASISFHRAGRQGSCRTEGASVCIRSNADLRKDKVFRTVDVPLGPLIDKQQGEPAKGEGREGRRLRYNKRKVGITGIAGMPCPRSTAWKHAVSMQRTFPGPASSARNRTAHRGSPAASPPPHIRTADTRRTAS